MSFSAKSNCLEMPLSVINVDHDYQEHHDLTDKTFALSPGDISASVGEYGVASRLGCVFFGSY